PCARGGARGEESPGRSERRHGRTAGRSAEDEIRGKVSKRAREPRLPRPRHGSVRLREGDGHPRRGERGGTEPGEDEGVACGGGGGVGRKGGGRGRERPRGSG